MPDKKPNSLKEKISMFDAQRAAENKEREKYDGAAKFAVSRIKELNKVKDELAKIEKEQNAIVKKYHKDEEVIPDQTKEVPDQMKEQVANLKRSVEALQNQINLAVEEIFTSPVFQKYEEQERITRGIDPKGNDLIDVPAGNGIISITKEPDGNYSVKQMAQKELSEIFK